MYVRVIFALACVAMFVTPTNAWFNYRNEIEGVPIHCTSQTATSIGIERRSISASKNGGTGQLAVDLEVPKGVHTKYVVDLSVKKITSRRLGRKSGTPTVDIGKQVFCSIGAPESVSHTCRNIGMGTRNCRVCHGNKNRCWSVTYSVNLQE
ncbi:MAG: hypothetical protein WA021_02165 [Minisyncoccia bacterium]